jgi:ribonuclease-3
MIELKNLEKIEDKIGIKFNNKKYLIEALSHRSYLNENPAFRAQYGLVDGHNERLEHLGDSVLGLVIAEKFYYNHPGREGDLTAIKSHFVNGNNMAEISDKIGLENFLFMGRGEINNKLGHESIIANTLEALIAAIFIDQGYDKVKEFVNRFFLYDLDNILENVGKTIIEDNPINHLQEIVQAAGFDVPRYEKTKIEGPENDPTFLYKVYINNEKIAEASGKKKEVKKNAAINALASEFIKNLLPLI